MTMGNRLITTTINLLWSDSIDTVYNIVYAVPLHLQTSQQYAVSIIIRSHRSTTYVDADYCYQPSSMVCR